MIIPPKSRQTKEAGKTISTFGIIKEFLLDLVFPRVCVGCKKLSSSNICPACRATITLNQGFACAFCHAPVVNGVVCPLCRPKHRLDQLLVAASYEQPVIKEAVKIFKYSFVDGLADELSAVMVAYLKKHSDNGVVALDDVIIIPVPLSAGRLRWRGFNQSELLAEKISTYLDLPLYTGSLKRTKNTKPQADIDDRDKRIQNISGAFVCPDSSAVKNKKIILVDDVSTTGSTLDQCATVLKAAGVERVTALVLARG